MVPEYWTCVPIMGLKMFVSAPGFVQGGWLISSASDERVGECVDSSILLATLLFAAPRS